MEFISGSSYIPATGFGPYATPTVVFSDKPPNYLPEVSTCAVRLSLPLYPTYECLSQHLTMAIRGCESFDLA